MGEFLWICFCIIAIHISVEMAIRILKKKETKSFLPFKLRFIRGIAITICILIGMQFFSFTKDIYQTLLANISLLVVVAGFIAQESIKNILSGLMLVRSKPFDIGQRVTLTGSGITGTIKDITLQHTLIERFDNIIAVIPNSVVNNQIIENSAYNNDTMIANFLDIQVAYESNIDRALGIIKECVKQHPLVIKEKDPSVLVRNLGTNGYDVRATIWTNTVTENFQTCSDLRILIKKEFDLNGIEIPYTKIETMVHN